MKNIVIEGKNYISSKRAAELMGYTQDYIGQLARSGKISAKRISGVWYVHEDEFLNSFNKKKSTDRKIISSDSVSIPKRDDKANEFKIKKEPSERFSIEEDKSAITFDGVDYISSKRAAELMGYTQDYIGQLYRAGKIKAKKIGRGLYVSKSAVNKGIEKSPETKQEAPKKDVFGDIIVYKKQQKKDIPTESTTPVKIKKEEKPLIIKKENYVASNEEVKKEPEKEAYFYPSFLSASYSIDETPLVPEPKRSHTPVLHEIVSGGDEDTTGHNIAIRRSHGQIRRSIAEDTYDSGKEITKDVLALKKNKLAIKPPLSLVKIASVGAAVLLFVSVATYVPHVSVFSAVTGTVETVYAIKTPSHNTLKANVTASAPKMPLIEVVVRVFTGFFEETIEYKAK